MKARPARIDRRLELQRQDGVDAIVFRDAWGKAGRRYDLGELDLPPGIVDLFGMAFRGHYAALSADTARHAWGALKVFARFVRQDGLVCNPEDLTTSTVGRYVLWLEAQMTEDGRPWTSATRKNHFSAFKQVINWIKRHHPEQLPARIDLPYDAFPITDQQSRPRLPTQQIKSILSACYEEIDDAWVRFETGRAILAAGGPIDGVDPELCRFVRGIASAGNGTLASSSVLKTHGLGVGMLNRQGGVRLLAAYLHLTGETMVPFFIAIAVQTAGNPDALRYLRRDCRVAHPLDEHRTIVEWGKPRAGSGLKRAQRRSFDRRHVNAAPNLIDKVLAMTVPLVEQAQPQYRELLFLVRSEKTGLVAPIPSNTLLAGVKRFIDRANARITVWNRAAPDRRREPISDFTTAFLRGSVATAHYKASGGDILAVQALLNHRSVATTDGYVRGPEVLRLQAETIARLQRQLIAWIATPSGASDVIRDAAAGAVHIRERRATVPFGHDCLNPLSGIAPGATPGRLCPRFGGCLRCPGLVIPLDVEHLARILQAVAALEDARARLDPRRWAMFYEPNYRIMVDEILPDFPQSLHAAARLAMLGLPLLPVLE